MATFFSVFPKRNGMEQLSPRDGYVLVLLGRLDESPFNADPIAATARST
jgi:hypothetical protein